VKQDPEYLRNQSRWLHPFLRQQRSGLNIAATLFAIFFGARFLIASADRVAGLGWGYSKADIWGSLGFVIGSGAIWIFGAAIHALISAYVRHTYGPEPKE